METRIDLSPDFSLLTVDLDEGESVIAEKSALVSMTPNVKVNTTARGGVWSSLMRRVLTKESIFQNTFTATSDSAHVKLAPPIWGEAIAYPMRRDKALLVQASSYLANTPGITMDTKFQGLKGFLSSEGLFFVRLRGSGLVWINTYGAVHEYDVDGQFVIDTGHVVAFESTLNYRVGPVAGLKSTIFSGECLVCQFRGKGKVFLQTRKPVRMGEFLHEYRPIKKKRVQKAQHKKGR